MLKITIPESELYDENRSEFVMIKEQTLHLEHSLISLSKWEAKWHKPFLSKDPKTDEELLDYVRCMTTTPNVNPEIYLSIPKSVFAEINDYLEDSMTATWFSDNKKKTINREVITAEVIYYWMISLNIPFECEKWHLNRLFTLIEVCNVKNTPPKKMSKKDLLSRNRSLNASRRKRLNSSG